MNRKKSACTTKQPTDHSFPLSRDQPTRKLSFAERQNRPPQDRHVNASTELPRKTSVSSKSELKELEQLEKQAITHFYSKQCELAFELLHTCEKLALRLQSLEHRVYLCYLQAQFSFKLGQYERSLEFYQRSKQLHCGSEIHKKLGSYFDSLEVLHISILFERKEYLELLLACDPFTDRLEQGSRPWLQCKFNKMKALLEIGRNEQARTTAIPIIEQSILPNEQPKFALKVALYFERKELADIAIELLELAARLSPDITLARELYVKLAELHTESKCTIGAIYSLEMVVRSYRNQLASEDQQLCKAQGQLARLYRQIGNYERSLEVVRQIIGAAAQNTELEADCLSKLNRQAEAVELYWQLLERQHSLAVRLSLRLKILMNLESQEKVEMEQQNLLKEAESASIGQSVVALTEYANYLRKQAQFETAEEFYKQAAAMAYTLDLPQYSFIILSNLGEMLEELDRRTESLSYYGAALRLNVQHELVDTVEKRVHQLLHN